MDNLPAFSVWLTIAATAVLWAWSVFHCPHETALGTADDDKKGTREQMIGDVRAISGYCIAYMSALGVAFSILASQNDSLFHLNQSHLWPFVVAFASALLATLYLPTGYGEGTFPRVRFVWCRSVMCNQAAILFIALGVYKTLHHLLTAPEHL